MPMRPQAKTMAEPARIPLVPELGSRVTAPPFNKDARLYNVYAEKTGERDYDIYKRFGLGAGQSYAGPTAQGRGIYYSAPSSTLLSVFDGNLYNENTVISAVEDVGSVHQYFFEDIVGTPRLIVLGDGYTAYVYNTQTRTITRITDVNFPTEFCKGWAYLNGYLYIMDLQGSIWGTAGTDAPLVWSGTNVIQASSSADMGVALMPQLSYIVAFKQWTTQVFYDAGNPSPGSSLGVVSEAQIPYGCASDKTIQSLDGTILWMTAGKNCSPQIARLDNLATTIISTPAVERILSEYQDNSSNTTIGVFSWVLKHGGHRLYGLTIVSLNITLVYDLDQQLWSFWTDQNGNYWPIFSMTTIGGSVQIGEQFTQIAQGSNNGYVYYLDTADVYPNDAGVVVPVDIYTRNFDAGTSRNKMLGGMFVEADRQSGSTLLERHSDDDYNTWSNWRPIDLSRARPFLRDLGTFRKRAFHFRHASNTSLRLRAVDAQMDFGVF